MSKIKLILCALCMSAALNGAAAQPPIGELRFAPIKGDDQYLTKVINEAKLKGYSFNPNNTFKKGEFVLVRRHNGALSVGVWIQDLHNGFYRVQYKKGDPKARLNPQLKVNVYRDDRPQFIGKFPGNHQLQNHSKLNHTASDADAAQKKSKKAACDGAVSNGAQQKTASAHHSNNQNASNGVNGSAAAAGNQNKKPQTSLKPIAMGLQTSPSLGKDATSAQKVIAYANKSVELSQEVMSNYNELQSFIKNKLPLNRKITDLYLKQLVDEANYYLHGAGLEAERETNPSATEALKNARAWEEEAYKLVKEYLHLD